MTEINLVPVSDLSTYTNLRGSEYPVEGGDLMTVSQNTSKGYVSRKITYDNLKNSVQQSLDFNGKFSRLRTEVDKKFNEANICADHWVYSKDGQLCTSIGLRNPEYDPNHPQLIWGVYQNRANAGVIKVLPKAVSAVLEDSFTRQEWTRLSVDDFQANDITAQTIHVTGNGGFHYDGMQPCSQDDLHRPLWFGGENGINLERGKPVYDDTFYYNSRDRKLYVDNASISNIYATNTDTVNLKATFCDITNLTASNLSVTNLSGIETGHVINTDIITISPGYIITGIKLEEYTEDGIKKLRLSVTSADMFDRTRTIVVTEDSTT